MQITGMNVPLSRLSRLFTCMVVLHRAAEFWPQCRHIATAWREPSTPLMLPIPSFAGLSCVFDRGLYLVQNAFRDMAAGNALDPYSAIKFSLLVCLGLGHLLLLPLPCRPAFPDRIDAPAFFRRFDCKKGHRCSITLPVP